MLVCDGQGQKAGDTIGNADPAGARHGDRFTKDRWLWLAQVVADHGLPANATKVAVRICIHLNRLTGDAWPSQATLARAIGASVRTVSHAVALLCQRGHLDKGKQHGRNQVCRYRPVIKGQIPNIVGLGNARNGTKQTDLNTQPASYLNDAIGTQPPAYSEHTKETNLADAHEEICVQNPLNKPLKVKSVGEGTDEEFEQFYRAFPRKEGRDRAKAMFSEIVESGVAPGLLISEAARYAKTKANIELRYIKSPVTWLKDGCWKDRLGPSVDSSLAAQQPRPISEAWGGHPAAKRLAAEVGEALFNKAFAPCEVVDLGEEIVIRAPNTFTRDHYLDRNAGRIEKAFQLPVSFEVTESKVRRK